MLNSVVRLGKHEARQPVAVRVLLPVHEMLGRRHLQRIAADRGAGMRRRPQADDLRPERDRPVVPIARDVLQTDQDRHIDRASLLPEGLPSNDASFRPSLGRNGPPILSEVPGIQ